MRSREFEKKGVLNASLEVFWKKGFFNTSIEDLTKATGVSRSGLYGAFESKHGLFLATIDFYEEMIVDQIMGKLEKSNEGVSGIKNAFQDVAKVSEELGRLGCLVCNTSSEVSQSNKHIEKKVIGFHKRVRNAFWNSLKIAKSKGELKKSVNIDELADYLLGTFQGLAHAIRSPMSMNAIQNYVKLSLQVLN